MAGNLTPILLAHELLGEDPDEIAERSRFRRLDPVVKLLGALAFSLAVAFLTDLRLVALAAGFGLAVLLVSGLSLRTLALRYAPIAGLATFAATSVGVFRGPEAFAVLFLRILAASSVLFAAVLSTPSFEMARALRRLHLPRVFVNVFLLAYRYLFVFQEEAVRMRRARAARGADSRGMHLSRDALRGTAETAGMVLVRAHRRSRALYRALLSRHYTGDLPLERRRPVALPDVAFLAATLAASCGLLLASLGVVP